MHDHDHARWHHQHVFGTAVRTRAEGRTWWVIGITLAMMVVEIVAGILANSMALLADGWHMGTHAAALGVAAFAYSYTRRHALDARYSFGTGKVGALGGFASAVGLAIVALVILGESCMRLAKPLVINFDDALLVACIGLVVNLACALILREGHHAHDHEMHAHDHETHDHQHAVHAVEHHDYNLRGAYFHVLADALTSVAAIAALTVGKYVGWTFMDPVMGVVGALVIMRWSLSLVGDTSRVLLDAEVDHTRRAAIVAAIEQDHDSHVSDVHIWRIGPQHLAAIVSVVAHVPREPDYFKRLVADQTDLAHVTVEVSRCDGCTVADLDVVKTGR
jgi:cation diffusion facilitator family transporter